MFTTIYLDTIGCRLNEAEIQSWARSFAAAGHRVVGSPDEARVLVLNTCAVTGEAARKSRQFIRRIHRRNPGARIVVTGCFAELEPDAAASLPGVDLVVLNRDKDTLVDDVLSRLGHLDLAAMPALATEPGGDASHVYAVNRTRAFVKVQDGCRHRCTFCIVTIARGEERSRSPREIVDEINDLHRAGYQEVVLTGVHLGGYGTERGTSLRELVELALRETSIPRLRLSSLEPWDLPDGFWELWRDDRLMPHLHLPLQSGSDRVLREMGRRCGVADFRSLVADARRHIDRLTVTTDIIVGFPGESDDDWRQGLETIESLDFGHIHLFTYSPRAGTPAARRRDQVPEETKRRRSGELGERMREWKRRHHRRFLGGVHPVLWETEKTREARTGAPGAGNDVGDGGPGDARSDRHATRTWWGYTDNYLRVVTRSADDIHNRITPARLHSLEDGVLAADLIGAGS